ncbi:glycerol-3-phosphate dehydrogenase [Pseudohongiella acticola]|uniref:Glycerol-3-phosphate dehydrogenase n=1 Tax=Pseudohongiella acticola TaxID=1524254 RepID=A0A1E8CFK4_9GAMM|nr:glycerol-3-phosphate dehydrogenase [Pseudohongiella acticola]OFE11244.1 glycerol-3-phosphate dehydrogenase [Pseudohongiella acticola]
MVVSSVADSATLPRNVDLLVVGGGINGAGIAADAAGRGLSVLLCEKSDLGGATSSASTKLIHGGLRYLEYYEFRLVRESLAERETLLSSAPHIVWPLRFRLPHQPNQRPAWMIRAGLFLYDYLGKRVTLPASKAIRFGDNSPLVAGFSKGFEYSDCWVDDARLVVLNAMQARRHGAVIRTRTACNSLSAITDAGGQSAWQATLTETDTGVRHQVSARCVVNAAGPWVSQLGKKLLPEASTEPVRLVKGSHIVVPRVYDGDEAYMLQHSDGRVIFVIPYENEFSLIGTTEQDFSDDPAEAKISPEEVTYLLDIVNQYFRKGLSEKDVKHHFSGVRPLIDEEVENASKVSRDYTLELDMAPAPLLTVYGGKITTYRRLAEAVLHKLSSVFPDMGDDWTANAQLPGGEFDSQKSLSAELSAEYPWLEPALRERWVRQYGRRVSEILAGAEDMTALGACIGPGLYACEVDYLCAQEWARSVDDILWRRTKLGLWFDDAARANLEVYLQAHATQGS